ncbi:bile acid:sodium symporter family protein [Carboxylicivirga sp. N1Y90]|uniref:bile acid:sodium symporter family protein n=1 Tax=Carboxylicivirga fragile TaxID=3417571 RepID=UPI003D33F0FA|nr:bile acid:sodium symporter [Marinilabiliaceae bacterium N1Y90]
MLKRLDGFIIGLLLMIVLAWFIPELANGGGFLSLEVIADIGISLIFFFYGLKLSPRQMKEGLSNYRLHILVQCTTFLLFPVLVLLAYPFIKGEDGQLLWLAMFFLAALPSTVSSSVVMVVLAKGNVAGAIFNASISGLIGIVVTPLWMGLFLAGGDASFDFTGVMLSLILKILLPVVFGLFFHRYWGIWAKQHSKKLALFDKAIILIIVYKSFAHSFEAGIFQSVSIGELSVLFIAVVVLFILIYFIVLLLATRFNFNQADKITALFCGSKKSLVHGSVMSKVLFEGMAGQGLFLLPIMLYHALQLIVISFIAQKMAKRNE